MQKEIDRQRNNEIASAQATKLQQLQKIKLNYGTGYCTAYDSHHESSVVAIMLGKSCRRCRKTHITKEASDPVKNLLHLQFKKSWLRRIWIDC
jgi:hypothetical protein